jgi:hypothetical protein
MATPLDSGQVGCDLLLGDRLCGGSNGLRVVEGLTGLAGLFEHGVEASVHGVLLNGSGYGGLGVVELHVARCVRGLS